jgi:hypothetical protein
MAEELDVFTSPPRDLVALLPSATPSMYYAI